MTVDRAVMMFAGAMVLLSLALGFYVSSYWYLLNAFVGLNLMQASVTGLLSGSNHFQEARHETGSGLLVRWRTR